MGNDGGSIPKRDDLVKTKRADQKADKQSQHRQKWSYCALSKQPLRAPIVSCALGKLYNKEAVIAHLLASPPSSTPFGSDGLLVASHIRSLRDLATLSLTPNPTLLTQSALEFESSSNIGTQENQPTSAFVCPISLREMNGTVKFVYRRPCGCVMSESSLKEMRKAEGEGSKTNVCPVTGEDDGGPEEWVTLNPVGEELELVRAQWDSLVAREKEEKKAARELKKRKSGGGGADDGAPPKEKKVKVAKADSIAPSIGTAGATVPKLSATLAAKIAEQKKSQSAAVASLYAPKDDGTNKDKDGRSNWMTRGAFTRYA
ncbi:hypothetical protein RQP46_004003 [Phenoliferia psychrophenolica]